MIRSSGVHIAGKLSYRDAIEKFWLANPTASQLEVRKATGAPRTVVTKVYGQLVVRGLLAQSVGYKRGRTMLNNL